MKRWPGVAVLLSNAAIRDWLYHRVRRATAGRFLRLITACQTVTVIGDARLPGKSKPAIASAFEAALLAAPK